MVDERRLSSLLSDFARTMVTDFDIQRILDYLVIRIVTILPITAAGVTLIVAGAKPRYVAASDPSALRFEQLQTELGEGPCLRAYSTGEPVLVADLGSDDRFPRFGPRALSAGLGAVFTFPLRQGGAQLGALDLYRDTPGSLGDDDMAAAQTLGDVTAAYLVNARLRGGLGPGGGQEVGSLVADRMSDAERSRSAGLATTLQDHLSRFTADLHAGGWRDARPPTVDASRFSMLDQLSGRQRETVDRLLRGGRVSDIAAAMYISSSTVRNNLSHVYSVCGGHSQSALLTVLRSDSEGDEPRAKHPG
jgi:DNA-binding CsgD family transcriptional regulator